jgi:hypothetical protein
MEVVESEGNDCTRARRSFTTSIACGLRTADIANRVVGRTPPPHPASFTLFADSVGTVAGVL